MIRPALFAILVLLAGCEARPTTGPIEPAWDRDACNHCRMTLSDRRFATQIRGASDGKVRHFDDPGCAALWSGKNGSPDDEIWVRDADGDGWLDARSAAFASGYTTPMLHGYAATANSEGGLDWATVAKQVQEKERERRKHTTH